MSVIIQAKFVRCTLTMYALIAFTSFGCRSSEDQQPLNDKTVTDEVASQPLTSEIVRGPVTLNLSLSPGKPGLSDEPELTVTVTAEDGVDVTMPPFGASVGEFLIRDFHEPLAKTSNGRQILQQVYTLEPLTSGTLLLQPMEVQFVDNRTKNDGTTHTVVSDPMKVEVSTIHGDAVPSLLNLKPAEQPVSLPEPAAAARWWWLVGGVVLALGGLVVLAKWIRSEPRPEIRTPQELANEEMEELLKGDLADADVKEFFVRLTGVVRRYIERSTGVRAPEQTTEEFLREATKTGLFEESNRTKLRSFLESADLVKFAGFRPDTEAINTSVQRARQFVNLSLATPNAQEASA